MYIVSDKRMYRLRADRTGRPHIDREMSYRNSGIPKPSQVDAGSGATPTIPPGGLVAITDNADPMDAVVYRTATRLRHHQHRVVCQVPVFAKSASASENSLIGSGHSLSVENNYGYQDPFAPHTGAITRLRLRAGGHQQARQRLRAGVDKPHRERPQRGYQSSPRQPRLDRALGASASGADQPRAHGATSPPPRLSPPPLSCHLARSRETAPPGDSGHEIRASPRSARTRYAAETRHDTYLREHECGSRLTHRLRPAIRQHRGSARGRPSTAATDRPEGPGFPRMRVRANLRRRTDPRPRFHAPGGLSATSGRALLVARSRSRMLARTLLAIVPKR